MIDSDIYYHGKPCEKAGHTLRYTISRQCVECCRAYQLQRKKRKSEAVKAGKAALYYEGKPCKAFGHTLRYSKNDACVECQSAHDTARKAIAKRVGRPKSESGSSDPRRQHFEEFNHAAQDFLSRRFA